MKEAARKSNLLIVVIVTAFIAIMALPLVAGAAAISSGSLMLGDSRPATTSTYAFSGSNFSTGTPIRCAQILFNDASDGTGSTPPAMNTTSSTLDSSTLLTAGSWTVDNLTNGTAKITNAAGEAPSTSGNIVWGGILNPDDQDTYFGIVTTYSDAGCTAKVDTVTVAFVTIEGSLVQLTIDPTLSFNINAVGSGVTVNGVATTIGSTAAVLDFGNSVTPVAKGISAQALEVGTNAANGYVVYIRHTGDLTNGSSDTIDNLPGATNAVPTAFAAAGTEAWGYTTQDYALTTGVANRFQSGNWAAFTTANEPVIDNAGAVSSTETTMVGHQVGIASTTEAGTYQTTIIYTAASTY